MEINSLRLKHKNVIIDHAFNLIGIEFDNQMLRRQCLDILLTGGDLYLMLKFLKEKKLIKESNLTLRANNIYGDIMGAIKNH